MASNFINYTAHGVAESSDLLATNYGGHIFNLVADVDLDNGSVATLGDFVEDDVFNADIPATTDAVYLILTAPLIYEDYTQKMQEESNFYNAAGEIMRAYQLKEHDRFTMSTEAFSKDADLSVGQYVTVDGSSYALTTAGTEAPTGYGFIGYIYAIAPNGNYRVLVKRNRSVD